MLNALVATGRLKRENEGVRELIRRQSNDKEIIKILGGIGYWNGDDDGSWLKPLLTHINKNIRLLAVKNLGKIKNDANIPLLAEIVKNDSVTDVRREAVSSIGRLRSKESKPLLFEVLKDGDPKIVCQAIRALLVFKGDKKVDENLKSLLSHENEIISGVIRKEYFDEDEETADSQPHAESHNFLKNTVVHGDVRDVLRLIPDESFHLTFTSPPYYNARDYSIYKSYNAYIKLLEEVFRLTKDKTKTGRFLVVNTSPIIIPRVSRQHASKRYPIPFDLHTVLVNMGWEFIDDIVWLKPESSVKNRSAGFLQHRKPLGYKPNAVTEYLMVYRKQTSKLLDWNMRQYDKKTVEDSKVKGDFETSNLWAVDPKYDRTHSAVFPSELCRRVIEYYSYKGDLVFDPFAGSGTFGRTAKKMDRFFFLTEKEKKYFEYMKSMRVPFTEKIPSLFYDLEGFKKIAK